jgi:hypothetical protein
MYRFLAKTRCAFLFLHIVLHCLHILPYIYLVNVRFPNAFFSEFSRNLVIMDNVHISTQVTVFFSKALVSISNCNV